MLSAKIKIEETGMYVLANQGVNSLKPYEPSKAFVDLERELGITDIVNLASNENPRGPSPLALDYARGVLGDVTRYPDGNGYILKTKLAEKHNIDPAWITLGNGSNDVLDLIARVFLAPGNNAVFSKHAFAVYPIVTQASGAEPRMVDATPADSSMPYGHDLQAMAAAVDENTRVVFIANPNNPTGTWLNSSELEDFMSVVPASVIVVIDEAYFEYVDLADYPDTSLWLENYPNLIVTRTFSKAYGLAGLRIGYSLSHPDVSDLLNRVRQPFNVNSIAQTTAIAALQDTDYLRKSVQLNREGMERLTGAFSMMGLIWIPSVGNFVCVKVGETSTAVYEALLGLGVIVRPVDNYHLPGFIRITVGLPEENERVIQALAQILELAIPLKVH